MPLKIVFGHGTYLRLILDPVGTQLPYEDTHITPELQLLTTHSSGDLFCKEKQEQQKDFSKL